MNVVTGASGFVGSHVVRKLLQRGEKVRALVRKKSSLKNLEGCDVELVYGDVTDRDSLKTAFTGCSSLYHIAADYRLWAPAPSDLYRTNVQGTRAVLEVADHVGVGRIVYTSTVGALGSYVDGIPADEATPAVLSQMVGHYKRSKFLAEAEALAAAKAGSPVVIVNPSTPVGPLDVKPTPTGQMIVDFLSGRMPAYIETGLNLIDVRDVAQGHLLAMDKGKIGEKYILGYKNLSLKEILEILAKISKRPAPTMRIPRQVALGLAVVSTGMSFITGKPPRVPWEGVRMAGKKMYFDSSKAVHELGLPQGSIEEALADAVNWFQHNGYVKNTSEHVYK